jgi:hypothetical protein
MLLDTNIIIYACLTGGHTLASWTQRPNAAVASVVWIEALGFKESSRPRSMLSAQC